MNETETTPATPQVRRGLSGWQVALIVLAAMALAAGGTYWFLRNTLFAKEFQPVRLSAHEQRVLEQKLERLDAPLSAVPDKPPAKGGAPGGPEPEPYIERAEDRRVVFTERELNALIADNPDLARRLAIDLSEDLISAKLIVPVDPDFPILGGTTLKVKAGLEVAFHEGRPRIVLRGVSLMGVPIPNAWLGGIKHIDLVQEFGGEPGFWKSFADGIDYVEVEDGRLVVVLRE
jgi:hypothetical protein